MSTTNLERFKLSGIPTEIATDVGFACAEPITTKAHMTPTWKSGLWLATCPNSFGPCSVVLSQTQNEVYRPVIGNIRTRDVLVDPKNPFKSFKVQVPVFVISNTVPDVSVYLNGLLGQAFVTEITPLDILGSEKEIMDRYWHFRLPVSISLQSRIARSYKCTICIWPAQSNSPNVNKFDIGIKVNDHSTDPKSFLLPVRMVTSKAEN